MASGSIGEQPGLGGAKDRKVVHVFLKRVFNWIPSGLLLCFSFSVSADEVIRIDQLTNVSAPVASGMFKFKPDLVRIKPGESLVFLNSLAHHTVHSVPEIWPSGVKKVSISNAPKVKVQLDKEGFYGFSCRRHGLYGMTLLVVVGDPEGREGLKEKVAAMKAQHREKAAFNRLVDRLLAAN